MSADGEQGGVTQALQQCVGIESGPNGQGGMRVVVHFKNGGDEYALFSLLNTALAACQAEARGPIHETECWSTRA